MTGDERDYNLMLAIFSVAAAMVGVCLTGIGLLQVVSSVRQISTIGDELLAVDSIVFLGCCLVSFVALRRARPSPRLRQVADGLFFVGLIVVTAVCALVARALI